MKNVDTGTLFNGLLYSSGDISSSGNSGWLPLKCVAKKGILRLVPSGLEGTEKLDITLSVAMDPDGESSGVIHEFAQIGNDNLPETLIIPGGESKENLKIGQITAVVPPFWKFSWIPSGEITGMSFDVYATLSDS